MARKRVLLPPERGAVARAGAGNSRGLSGWRSSSGERGAAFLLPGPGGGVGHREGRAARVGGGPPRQPAAAGPRQAASADDAAAPPRPPGKPRVPQRPRSRPPPPGRLRLLPSHTPPGRPGPRPSRRSSSSPHSQRLGCSCRSPASQPPGRFLFLLLLGLSFHTHARARPGFLGRPLFLQPDSPSQSFKRRRLGWAED